MLVYNLQTILLMEKVFCKMIVGTIQQEVKSILSLFFYFVHHLHSTPELSQSLGVLYQRIETEVIGSCYERSLMLEVLASKL
jgi:hypothetical protein